MGSRDLPPHGNTVSVLLVEDSKVLAERLADAIGESGHARLAGIIETESEAIAMVDRRMVDVIVLDLHLRKGTGFGLLRALTKMRRMPKVIVLTNYDLPEYRTAALALGATYFLDKARDYDRLPALLEEIFTSSNAPH